MSQMKRMTTLLCALQVCWVAMVEAAPLSITLPPETAVFKANALPGYALAQQKCSTCHSADYISFQPRGQRSMPWPCCRTMLACPVMRLITRW